MHTQIVGMYRIHPRSKEIDLFFFKFCAIFGNHVPNPLIFNDLDLP